ncbi:MAG: RNA methyltransferase [Acidaminococcus sp.]|jgi:TrmH family RNA methyltransferase|nr:RNA methyltransferase [Acidaminococcus sp.]MCI2100314.1 RNA methyltransferase [Acidaminococcus sp.]MCI2114610.1 RNA methyltransferase [Acidaminococcus sp.]MCI2116611.1 RNA methyltransferase [Acidaminococcus sp.]
MIQTITSLKNEVVKKAASLKQKKYRQREQLFLLEGTRAVEEVRRSDWKVTAYFCTKLPEEWQEEAETSSVPYYVVTEAIMGKIAATEDPQSVAALVELRDNDLANFHPGKGVILVLDEIHDPGNAGTMIRTACAAGAEGVVLLKNSVDLYNPKVVRSAMGNLFHLPVFTGIEEEALLHWARGEGWQLVVTDLRGAVNLPELTWPEKTLLVMGSEAEGVSPSILEQADTRVKIPMYGEAESLNVAVATGILLYDCAVKMH